MVTLPSAKTPTQTSHEPSTEGMQLQVVTPSSSSSKLAKVLHYGDTFLDEEIVIPHFDFATMCLEDINQMQAILEKKKKQELLRKEYKQKIALQEIKDIFIDAFQLPQPDENQGIMEQLSKIVEQVSNTDQEPNAKLLEWSERKFHDKIRNNISSAIAISQAELGTKVNKVKEVIGNIISLYTKLCDTSIFTKDVHH